MGTANIENKKPTLDEIISKRNDTLNDVRASAERIKSITRGLFEPPKVDGKISGLLANFDRMIAIYDGILLGTKVIGRIRRSLHRR